MKKQLKLKRQGDLLFIEGSVLTPRRYNLVENGKIMDSEITGHTHRVSGGGVELIGDDEETMNIFLNGGKVVHVDAQMRHAEHEVITLDAPASVVRQCQIAPDGRVLPNPD